MENNKDNLLIERIKSGDSLAFQELLDENFKKSKSIIQKQYGLLHHDLEDVMQATSLKVWKHLKSFKQQTNFYNWFFSVFKNEALRLLYERNEINKNELSNIQINGDFDPEENINTLYLNALDTILNDTAKTFLEKKEDIALYKEAIINMLANLKTHHREIIELILIQEKSYKEAADILNIPLGSIMSRLHYAKIEAQKIVIEYSRNNEIELPI